MYQTDRQNYNKIAKDSCQNHFSASEFQDLYFKFYFWHCGNVRKKLINCIYDTNIHEIGTLTQYKCYPNNKLVKNFSTYEKESYNFVSLKIVKAYENAKKLYDEVIKNIQDDPVTEQWINTMMESDDVEFVEDNIEYKMCDDLKNLELWELYFQFLKKFDGKVGYF
uniref:Uncharacterized protein n=1 Tax=Panagrolaimus superbus TaxID=310955 RepID=A0A914XU79_9BILA